MWTPVIVLGSGLAVAAQIAVAAVYYDGSDVSNRAARIEEQLDREVHELLHPLVPAPR